MERKNRILIKSIVLFIVFFMVAGLKIISYGEDSKYDYSINLSDLSNYQTYETVEELEGARINGNLPEGIYITKFLYDGAGKVQDATVVNINVTGNIEIKGKLQDGMIAVNTNNKKSNINLFLNGVQVKTNNDKIPALYIYNKSIIYNESKVTIIPVKETENYLEGGRIKKVSLVDNDIYTTEQLRNIEFAKVNADKEDLADGDPAYFYKGAGAISSDIDLNFKGEGTLTVKSIKKEGIEGKGNITFEGGVGKYIVYAQDDAINTTTTKDNATDYSTINNKLKINVESLAAIVETSAEEGDAIDSNGSLTIDGGLVIAIAHPNTADNGLDADNGIYINGGTVLAVENGKGPGGPQGERPEGPPPGDKPEGEPQGERPEGPPPGDKPEGEPPAMGEISKDSKQKVLEINFSEGIKEGEILFITDINKKPLIAFKTDRTFQSVKYSSNDNPSGEYHIFVGDKVIGKEFCGVYTNITDQTLKEQYQANGSLKFISPNIINIYNNVSKYNENVNNENNKTPDNKVDDDRAKVNLPNAGKNTVLLITIIALSSISIISFIKYKNKKILS